MEDARNFPNLTVRVPTSFLVMHISPAFFEQPTPFPHTPVVHGAFTIHFNYLPMNFPPDEHF
jgi:hypothetical protein